MEQNYSQVTSPLLQSEDYDDFKRWQERKHGTGQKVRTLVTLVLAALMYYAQYSAMKTRHDRLLTQYSALKAQYNQNRGEA